MWLSKKAAKKKVSKKAGKKAVKKKKLLKKRRNILSGMTGLTPPFSVGCIFQKARNIFIHQAWSQM
jgi:hypothetical protein